MIYFDNAATTGKKPETVIKAVVSALKNNCANPGRSGHKLSVKTVDEIYKIREKTASFFGLNNAEKVIFTHNCTTSINMVLKGVLKRGDHIVVSSLEHNAVMRPLEKMRIPYSIAEVSLTDDNITAENFKKAIKPNTRMIFCTAASNVCGKILPIEKIGEICKEKGILFGVDAAQGAGVLPINMQKMNIDYLCVAAHKGLYAPMSSGILLCKRDIENTIFEGGTGTGSLDFKHPNIIPEGFESGTLSVPNIFGIGAGIDYVNQKGLEKIYKSELNLIKNIYFSLRNNPIFELYTPEPLYQSYVPVLPFNLKGVSSEKTAALLDEYNIAVRGGLHCAPSAHKVLKTAEKGAVRVSVATFNNENEVSTFLNTIKSEKFIKNLIKN
ncbi:MAG: aminotransferase class V-fold PLP-dependent enzyme [Clostridia bacterium]|nr:aminotransferase class V-fold PLP-dependent enzyme [Clostridia bacterium]